MIKKRYSNRKVTRKENYTLSFKIVLNLPRLTKSDRCKPSVHHSWVREQHIWKLLSPNLVLMLGSNMCMTRWFYLPLLSGGSVLISPESSEDMQVAGSFGRTCIAKFWNPPVTWFCIYSPLKDYFFFHQELERQKLLHAELITHNKK